MADRELGRVGAWAEIFRHFQLFLALDHLEQERQPGDESDHGDKPRRTRMRGNEVVDRFVAVDARTVFQIGAVGILMALAKAHQRLVRPWIVVQHGYLNDPRRQFQIGATKFGLDLLQLAEHLVGMNNIRIEPHQIRRVRRTDFRHTRNAARLQLGADRHALEEGFKRHFLVDLGEDVLIAAEGITDRAHLCSLTQPCRGRQRLKLPPVAAREIRYRNAPPARQPFAPNVYAALPW